MFSQGEGNWMVLPNGKQTTIKTKRFMIEGIGKNKLIQKRNLNTL